MPPSAESVAGTPEATSSEPPFTTKGPDGLPHSGSAGPSKPKLKSILIHPDLVRHPASRGKEAGASTCKLPAIQNVSHHYSSSGELGESSAFKAPQTEDLSPKWQKAPKKLWRRASAPLPHGDSTAARPR